MGVKKYCDWSVVFNHDNRLTSQVYRNCKLAACHSISRVQNMNKQGNQLLKTLFNIMEERFKKLLNLMSVLYNDVQKGQ